MTLIRFPSCRMKGFVWLLLAVVVNSVNGVKVVTTWVFGHVDDLTSYAGDINNRLREAQSPGFIRLSFDGSAFEIALVRRPSGWPINERFCSVMLPAAVHAFFELHDEFSVKQIQDIGVVNRAIPREAGCRCYVALMRAMGANTINDLPDVVPAEFCKAATGAYIEGTCFGRTKAVLPQSSSVALAVVQQAQSVTRVIVQ